MANTFAFAELRAGTPRKVAFEAVTAARVVADATGGGEVHALVLGGAGASAAAAQLARYGADVVHVVEHPGLTQGSAEVFAATAGALLKAGGYRAGFFSASAQGRDLAPRVARHVHRQPAHEAEVGVGVHLEAELADVEVERFVLIEDVYL